MRCVFQYWVFVSIFLSSQLFFVGRSFAAKNIVLMIGDGMGVTHVTVARIHAHKANGRLEIDKMPYTAKIKTYSEDSLVTDSAAAATAFATGHKVKNEVISLDKGQKLTTILELAKQQGKSVGVITTTGVTHATPAAFYAHSKHRDGEQDIAMRLLQVDVDVALGGGKRFFSPKTRKDGQDLIQKFKDRGTHVVFNRYELRKVPQAVGSKVLGLFADNHMSYVVERKALPEPTLPEMTHYAIQILSQNPKGYFLMIEGGRIDHAAHENLALHMMEELIDFDKALTQVLQDVELKDTLVLLTADHATGGIHVNGYPSHEQGLFGHTLSWGLKEEIHIPTLTWTTGPNAIHPSPKLGSGSQKYRKWQPAHFPALSSNHTGEDVTLYAHGKGAEQVHGTLNNTDVFRIMKSALAKQSVKGNL